MEGIKVADETMIGGMFVLLELDNVSYYPTPKIARLIALNVYGVDTDKMGLGHSEKYQADMAKGDTINLNRPLGHCDVEGDFILFLREGKPTWGMMDIRRVMGRRPDINLSIVSLNALMPNRLDIKSGSVSRRASFTAFDRDGSQWTLHCK